MKMLNAWTLEPDDTEAALASILGQLDLENNLLAHSIGFMTCSYDFIETGMVKAICDALPFDVVGGTSLANGVNEEAGSMLLCLTVLTADDCCFSSLLTPPLQGDVFPLVNEAYSCRENPAGETPGLILAFMPMIGTIGGELLLVALDKATGGVPVFGTVCCDYDTAEFTNTFVIHNGECYRDRMAMLLFSGNVRPHFVVMSTSEHNQFKQQAVITASEGTVLKSVNGVSPREYLTSIGLVQGSGIEGVSSIPFIVDYNDGTQPVARAIYSLNEDGSALCGGIMPKGGTLALGRMDIEDILWTAKSSVNKLLDIEECCGVIFFPCLGRNMVLGENPLAEVMTLNSLMGNTVPWHLAYSGGEVCPVYTENGTVNRFHNFTFIACAL